MYLFKCAGAVCCARIVVLSRSEKNHPPGFEAQRKRSHKKVPHHTESQTCDFQYGLGKNCKNMSSPYRVANSRLSNMDLVKFTKNITSPQRVAGQCDIPFGFFWPNSPYRPFFLRLFCCCLVYFVTIISL